MKKRRYLVCMPAIVALVSGLGACGLPAEQSGSVDRNESSSDVRPEWLRQYCEHVDRPVREFEARLGGTVQQVPVVFSQEEAALGRCVVDEALRRHVELASPARHGRALSRPYLEQLIFHELGHCVLGRAHLAGQIVEPKTGTKMLESIMGGISDDPLYSRNREYYLEELFDHREPRLDDVILGTPTKVGVEPGILAYLRTTPAPCE